MTNKFEDYFNVCFDEVNVIGPFEAIKKLGINKQELFNTFVNKKDFLKLYGQTIKKINNVYIVNYDLPALLYNYDVNANIFVILVRFKNKNCSFFEINQSISNEIKSDNNIIRIDEDKDKEITRAEKLKRTYHISSNHIRAMFDMTDFVFNKDGSHITFDKTPLGRILINSNIITDAMLIRLKKNPIVYINENNKKKLVNINEEANEKNIEESINLIKNIENKYTESILNGK